MKRKVKQFSRSFLSPKTRTRCRRRNTPALLRPALLLLCAAVFILILIPFALTTLFVPTVPSERTEDKTETVPVTDTIKKVSLPNKIKVYRQSKGVLETLSFESYVKGVVASEMPSNFEPEALKAQAVAARTYSAAKYLHAKKNGNSSSHSAAPVCDTVHCQVFQGKVELKKRKGSQWMKADWKKICAAVDATKGQLMYYKGELVQQALFHSSSGGKTENCEDVFTAAVPYLVSVDSPYEDEATHKKETLTLPLSDFEAKMKAAYPNRSFGNFTSSNIKIKKHSSGGRVEQIQLGKASASGKEVREALDLYSANFKISIKNGNITFTTTGSGHGVGMSQYGANGMAKKGYTYKEILSHYYSGITIQ